MNYFSNLAKQVPYFNYKPIPFVSKKKKQKLRGAPKRGGPKMQLTDRPRLRKPVKRGNTKIKHLSDNSSMTTSSVGGRTLAPFMKNLLKNTQPVTTMDISSGNAICLQGRQQVASWAVLNNTDLAAIKTALVVGSAQIAAPVRFYLRNAKVSLTLRNQSNVNCRLAIYDVITRRLPQTTSVDTPAECWKKGGTDHNVTDIDLLPGQTPFKSPEFSYGFKVTGVKYISLEPGQQHQHITYHSYNKTINSVSWENANQQSLVGITRHQMIAFYGHLSHDTANAALVTTSPITLDWLVSRQYTYSALQPYQPRLTMTQTLPTTIVNLDQMGSADDVDNDPAAA